MANPKAKQTDAYASRKAAAEDRVLTMLALVPMLSDIDVDTKHDEGRHLCAEIDHYSKLVVHGQWYSNERIATLEDTFKKAREIAPHAGIIKSVLRLFDELVKCDEEGVLKGVREVIEGKGT